MKQLVVNREDLKHNINQIRNYAESTAKENPYTIIGVVKGNGYGMDLVEYATFLTNNGIEYLAVATIEEALQLAQEKITSNIFLLSTLNVKEDAKTAVEHGIILTIDSLESAKNVIELAQEGYNIKIHIKVDTGFGRYGLLYNDDEKILNIIKDLKENNVEIEGIFSHLSNAYYKKDKHTIEQFKNFENILKKLKENNIEIKLKHICNSPAFLNYPEMHLNCARIGSAFVGRVTAENNIGLKKIGSLEVEVAEVKTVPKGLNISYSNTYKTKNETKIAILPVGYLEGYNVGKKTDMFRTIDKLRRAYGEIKSLVKKQKLTAIINEKRYDIIGTIRNVSCYS